MPKKNRHPRRRRAPAENPPVDALTVAWMLSVTTTTLCAGVAALAWIAVRGRAGNEYAVLLMRYLHFSSIVTAVVSLVLLGVVLRKSGELPPRGVIVFAVVVAMLPILAALLY